jgi:DNA-binding CsgD family transcriptional regulator
MQFHIDAFKFFFKSAFYAANPLSLKAITKKNLPYFIGWIAVFIWLYSYFLPMGEFRFQSRLYNGNVGSSMLYYYIWLFSGSLIPSLFHVKRFIPMTMYSVLVTLACFGVMSFTNPGIVSEGIMVIAAICIGHIFASYVYGFFMVLNNSEKFYSMVLAILLPRVLMMGKPFINKADYRVDASVVIILIIMLILLGSSYFLRSHILQTPSDAKTKVPVKAYSLMPLVFVELTLNDVIAPSALHHMAAELSKRQIESFYFFGILIGIFAVIFLQKRFSINIYNMLNISFALLAAGFTVNLASIQNSNVGYISAVCFGSSYAIGFINIYYLAGFMAKKFQSILFYRIGILLSALYYFIGFIFQNTFKESGLLAPPAMMALISIGIVLLFFIMSPFFIKMLYSGEWIDDTYRYDVTKCSRLEARLKDFKMTPSEIEVCKLLLDGYTLRQISGMQSKAYATINTYCTSIYRKLNINSRAELLLFLQDYKT